WVYSSRGTAVGAGATVVNTTSGGGTYSASLVDSTIYKTFPSDKPTTLSAWVRGTGTHKGSISMSPVATLTFAAGIIGVQLQSGIAVPYAADTWVHVELRNIDWQNWTFDVVVNDLVVARQVPWAPTDGSSQAGIISLASTGTMYWDEIAVFKTTCL